MNLLRAASRSISTSITLAALSFAALSRAQTPDPAARPFAQGDLDGDGFADLVIPADSSLQVFFGSPSGVAARPVSLALPNSVPGQRTLDADAIEDLDGDRSAELVVVTLASDAQPRSATIYVRVYAGGARTLGRELWSGSWRTETTAFHESQATLRAAGDLDGDGRNDLVAAGFALFGGTRGAPLRTVTAQPPSTRTTERRAVLPIGDVDGDGRADLWVAPIRRATPPPYYGAPALRGAGGQRFTLTSQGWWRITPMPLFEGLTGNVHLQDLRPIDVDGDHVEELVATWFIPTMAVNAHIPGSVGLQIARRIAPGRFDASAPRIATQTAEVLHGAPYLRCAHVASDGSTELVTALGSAFTANARRWSLRGTSAPISAAASVVPSRFDCARDHDGDGRPDLVEITRDPRVPELRARTLAW